MSSNFTTVEPDVKPEGGLGNRDDKNMRAAFPGTPTYNEYNADAVLNAGISALNGNGGAGDAIVPGVANGVVSDGGYFFSSFDLNYGEAPDVAGNAATAAGKDFGDGGGAPTTSHVPPLSSPGEGNGASHSKQPAWTGNDPKATVPFGVGDGLMTPSKATAGAEGTGGTQAQTIKNLTLGSSLTAPTE